ncbi:rRNA maturation RNase YbeY [Rickettsiales bacterium]|nr:rRNA maturation RNase YbeY [Rickettsiales bacterium]
MKIKTQYDNVKGFNKASLNASIRKLVDFVDYELKISKELNRELSVLFTDNKKIKELNYKYRKLNQETNVLSFPQNFLIKGMNEKTIMLGDIVISLEKIQLEAKLQSKFFLDHFTHIFLHGYMHLLGYDHIKRLEAQRMEETEIKILAKLSISNPYIK